MKRVWDNASVRKAKNLNKDEFFFGCRNVAMAQIGNNLQNINSISFINSNNSIPLPQFGVNYAPPTSTIGNSNIAPNNDDDDFISIEEDQDKAIKPQESIHQAELNLVNSLMKEFSVSDAIEEKKKNEEIKRKQEEEEKKKKEIELQKKNEESQPKKNLDDLFNFLDNLPKEEPKPTTPMTPPPQDTQLNQNIQESQTTENKKEIEDDEFISIEEENVVNEKKNAQNIIVNEIKDDKTEADKRENLEGIDFTDEVNNGPKDEEKEKENVNPIHSGVVENNNKPTLDELMNAFQVTGNNEDVKQSIEQEKKEEKEQNEEINDDDFCEVEEDTTNNVNNEVPINTNNNDKTEEPIIDKKEIMSVPNIQIPVNKNIIEVQVEKKEEVKEEPKEEKKQSILNLSPLDFLQEFKKEIEPTTTTNTNSNPPNDNKDNNEDNQFEFVQEDEQEDANYQASETLSPSEKLLAKNFNKKELKDQFISNLKKVLETLTNEIKKNIPFLKKLLPYSEKLKISKSKLTLPSNLKLVNYLNGIIYLLLDYTTLWNTKHFITNEISKKALVYEEVLHLIKEISKGENFKQIFKEDALNKLTNLDKEKFVTKNNEKDCLICLQNLNKEGNTNVFGYDFHISCVNIWLNLIESNSPYKLT